MHCFTIPLVEVDYM